jgi:ATP-binding cassette subfamily B protein
LWVLSLVPRTWLLASAAIFGWLFAVGVSTSQLAVTIASLLLAFEGLRHLVQGLPQIAGASIALETLRPMLDAGARPPNEGNPSASVAGNTDGALFDVPLLEAQDLVLRTAAGDRTLLETVNLTIRKGDRILLEGASGGGKSTLASVLAGLRHPDRGALLLGGLDLATLGESAWRQRVSLAAQFHENHIVSATLAFNLLMGRQWPPTAHDYDEAETICRELGLGEVLARMPGGLDQMVGESGWQLSHGEKSRIYLARALLQRADLVILDESLAALDPQSFEIALQCALRRAPALVVVAHR